MTAGKLSLVLLFMTVIVLAGSLVQLQPVSGTFPGANGKIVFSRDVVVTTRAVEIFTVNPDGSDLTQLTFTGAGVFNSDPRWSANGAKIVFKSNRDGNFEIWTMNADGSDQTQITFTPNTVQNNHPAFSPDGSKIVFVRDQNIWVMNADGSNQIQLTSTGNDVVPVWSPDGSKIVFVRNSPGPPQIYVMNSDGSSQTNLSNNPDASDREPEWSPDQTRIAFRRYTEGAEAIWVMNADGTGQTKLTAPPSTLADVFPAWSPDGRKIAFVRLLGGSIWVMNADGSNPVDITQSQPNSDSDNGPNWQPIPAIPVGGVVTPINKLEILTPFIALIGLVAAISTIFVIKKRK